MNRHSKRAFTMLDLLVVVFLCLVAAIIIPACGRRSYDISYRNNCASNLRHIGLAMKVYSNDDKNNSYPRTRYARADASSPKTYTQPTATNPFADDGPGPNDVTSAMWLLVRETDITPNVFICPASTSAKPVAFAKGQSAKSFSNFSSQANLSYSLQNPYPNDEGVMAGFRWNDSMSADFAIAADINPGVPELKTITPQSPGADQRKVNSPNHNYDGQNVLYADGHVDFAQNVWAGAPDPASRVNDNIYAFGKFENSKRISQTAGIIGSPADENDTILLPVWDQSISRP